MTTWAWKCRSCGYEFINPIFRFISKCPECQTEYIHLATAGGAPAIGQMPIYAIAGETIDNELTSNSILFAINTNATKIECYNRDFYLYIKEKFKEFVKKKKVVLEYVEKKENEP